MGGGGQNTLSHAAGGGGRFQKCFEVILMRDTYILAMTESCLSWLRSRKVCPNHNIPVRICKVMNHVSTPSSLFPN